MSTIVTRKSLAFGAIVALATTAFAGTPAQAAGEINLVPSAGTSYSTLTTDAFTLEASFAPGVVNGNAQLKYQVKTAASLSLEVLAADTTAPTLSAINGDTEAAGSTGDASDVTAFVQYATATGNLATERNFLGVKIAGSTLDSVDVVVTAFVDSNNDGKLTTGEWATAKTVSFKKYSDVAATIAVTDPKVGDKTASATLTLAGLNQSQIQSAVLLSFKKAAGVTLDTSDAGDTANAVAAANGLTATDNAAGAYAATTGTVDSTDGFDTGDTVYVTATVGGVSVGTAVTKTATARTISRFDATVDANDNGTAAGLARLNSKYSITATVFDTATTPVAVAGVAVTAKAVSSVTSWATTAGSEQTVTLNGVKYTTYAAFSAAATALTTDAKGQVKVEITPSNFASNDTIDVTFSAQNLSSSAIRATQSPAVYVVADVQSAAVRAIAKNTSATLNYTVKDQFAASATATNLRLKVTSALKTQFVAVAAGKATVVVTPTTDSTDSVEVSVALEASSVDVNQQTLWTPSAGANNGSAIRINVSAVANDFDTVPAIATINGNAYSATTNYKQTIENKAYTATDFPLTGATLASIGGSVNTDGAEVTVSGTGLAFVVGGKVYTESVTFPSAGSAAGNFTVLVAGHKAGVSTVTFKTGAITKTVDVTFDAAVLASLANTVVSAPSAAQAGRAVTVSTTLTDAYGNAIAGKTVKFAVAGVGSLSSSDAVTDASGVATVRLVSSYGEDGDSVVTVSHTGGDNAADTSATVTKDDFTLAKTITFGITDAQIDNVGKRVTAVASFTKGKTVSFYVDGVKKWSKLSASDADVVLFYNLKKGRHTVTMKISGGFITSEVIIVK
jgi:adhesin/invasin